MRANDFTADELVDLLGRVVAALHDQRVSPMEVLGDLLHEEVLQALGFGDDGPASALVRELRAFRRAAQAEIDAVLRGRDPDEAVLASAWTYPSAARPSAPLRRRSRFAADSVCGRGRRPGRPRSAASRRGSTACASTGRTCCAPRASRCGPTSATARGGPTRSAG